MGHKLFLLHISNRQGHIFATKTKRLSFHVLFSLARPLKEPHDCLMAGRGDGNGKVVKCRPCLPIYLELLSVSWGVFTWGDALPLARGSSSTSYSFLSVKYCDWPTHLLWMEIESFKFTVDLFWSRSQVEECTSEDRRMILHCIKLLHWVLTFLTWNLSF